MKGLTPLVSLNFPAIDPVLLSIPLEFSLFGIHVGPLQIRWYALAYIGGIVLGWRYAVYLVRRPPKFMGTELLDDFLLWVTLGIVLGGRLGYVLFYKPSFYLENPGQILAVWTGGMSFHGGMLGVTIAIILFAYLRRLPLLCFSDVVACVVPIGLMLGRVANFINGELWGRVTDVPWGMVFPTGGPLPRHPSQLYQASLEGVALFLLLLILERQGWRRHPGVITGAFLAFYGVARSFGELFREPDSFMGFVIGGDGGITMGQVLSAPMIIAGLAMIWRFRSATPRQ